MISTPDTRAMAQGVLDYIHEHPEDHNQRVFFSDPEGCGTSMCIAGTTIALIDSELAERLRAEYWHPVNGDVGAYSAGWHIENAAARALGLSKPESVFVFYDFDNESAVQKLKSIVVGESLCFDEPEFEVEYIA